MSWLILLVLKVVALIRGERARPEALDQGEADAADQANGI